MNEMRQTTHDGLHVTWRGQNGQQRIVLVHGSQWQHPDKNFAHQRLLAEQFELALPHRRGYGDSTAAQRSPDFEPDVSDIGSLLGTGAAAAAGAVTGAVAGAVAGATARAHVIGESYGAWVALLVALRWPQKIRSLTLIEPIAFPIAASTHPEVAIFAKTLRAVFDAANPNHPEQFAAAFLSVMRGQTLAPRPVSQEARQGILAMLSEGRVWDTQIDCTPLAHAIFPTWVVSGGWHPAFEATCDVLANTINAQRSVITGHGHSPQDADDGRPFNQAWLRNLVEKNSTRSE